MKAKGVVLALALVLSAPAMAQISGQYLEVRTADVYTGPCYANSEVNITGHEAVLAWRIEKGSWQNVALDGLSVVAVVRASSTLGDPYSNPLPARSLLIVDERASEAQRAALVSLARAQSGSLLNGIEAVEAAPVRLVVNQGGRHGFAILEAGNLARVSTRAITSRDSLCHNEEVYYPPLAANLDHAMPAVATESTYRGNHLGVNWSESGRRSAFVGAFSF
jgi:hypothetical protein